MAHSRRFGLTHETLKRENPNPEKMGRLEKWLVRVLFAPFADKLED